jgi:pyruvate dehydrogenase E1 component beta subunit
VAATIGERLFKALKAPVRRLGAPRAPISYAPPLEDQVRVTPEKIATAAAKLVAE